MRRILLSLLMAFITITAFSQSGDIAVTVVSSESGTGLTTINYGFTGQLNRRYNISVEVKFDAANYVQVPEAHLSGDLTDVSGTGTAFSGTIVWNGAAGFPELYHEQTRIRILATMINTTDIVDVTNPTTGKTWMDRNLGASRAATSSTDAEAYGDLYQWGRGTDGHENRTSTTTPTLSDSDNPGHGNFIVTSSSPNDWRSPQNDNLWQGVNGINNPCPSGYRIPSIAEWNAERLSWGSNDPAGAFGSQLKLSVGGSRHPVSASLGSVGEYGIYWSSALGGTNSQFLIFGSGDAVVSSANRANGYSVRCIKGVETLPTVTTSSTSNITTGTATSGGNVVSDGGVSVTARGVCWNTTGNPTIADSKTTDAAGYGTYTSSITGLTASTIYYVRAYATNSVGTAYGEAVQFTTGASGFTDPRDNNYYNTVVIGNQVWMAENLKYLPSVVGPGTGAYSIAYYYVYGYDGTDVNAAKATENYTTYGVLYNWNAAMNGAASTSANPSGVQGVCPAGWHLPSDAEQTQMENYLADNGYNYDGTIGGGSSKIAKSLASSSGWDSSPNIGAIGNTDYPTYRNKSGFTALPGGIRYNDGTFYHIGYSGHWWFATELDETNAFYRNLNFGNSDVIINNVDKELGFSVRCIRNSAD